MSDEHDDPSVDHANDIAIVAASLRVPGASNTEQFWQNVRDGVESVRQYSEDELTAAGVSGAELANPNYVRAGAPLADMEMFDAEFFGFGPKDAAIMDPQHRQFLECAWEALERAGHVPSRFGGAIGVFAGCGMGSYFAHNILSNRELVESVGLFLLRHTGNDKDFLATRASYCLDLHGPSVNVQTACSTSLVAVHLAVQSLLSGECDLALAGGVTIEFPHRHGYLYHEGEILSPDGHCRPFDHRAQGTVFGSGAGVVVLRRLSDALADGDPVIAVIKGSAVNNDGARKVGYLAPSVDGQAAAITEALTLANVTADSIGLVECHGTGTAMGDPIEVAALRQAFSASTERTSYCAIGSVKSNIGHLDTAAGVVALIKAALALKYRVLPPSLNFERANPQIDFEQTPFFVNDTLQPWPPGPTPRRAGVNSLGVGGTNAYMVLEEAPEKRAARSQPVAVVKKPQLLVLSARNRRSLAEQQSRLLAHLTEHPELALPDVAHTLWTAREHFDVRRVFAVRDREAALRALGDSELARICTHVRRDRPSVVFMFPGGGAQYPRMGAGLLAGDAQYRELVERGLSLAQSRFGLALRPLLLPEPSGLEHAARELERPSLQLPLLFIIEYALAQRWLARGVQPAALIGHSLGENTAACVAGVMDFETALGLVVLRGRLFESLPDGGMLSVPLSAAELTPLLPADVVIACENAPELCVASGPRASLDALEQTLSARGSEPQAIRIRIAAHSPMLEPILEEFGAYLRQAKLAAPRIPIISNLTGELLTAAEATDPQYWVRHLRNTVRFARGIATLQAEPGRVYLEVGPGRALSSLVRQNLADRSADVPIASLRHPDDATDDETFALTAFARLWASGVAVDLAPHFARAERVPLPTYAFDHKPYFIAPGKLTAASGTTTGRIPAIEDWFFQPVWRWRELERDELSGPEEQTYLLFADDLGIADGLARRLQAAGHRTVFVRKSGAYGQTDVLEYEVAPHAPHSYATLVQELRASEKLPDRIIHLWGLDSAEQAEKHGEWAYDANHRALTFDSLFHLLRAFGAESVVQPMHLTVVTTGALRVMAEPMPHPEQALVKGIVQVIPREAPHVSATWIDLPQPQRGRSRLRSSSAGNVSEIVQWLEREARSKRKSGTIAYRDARRFEQDVEAAPRATQGTNGGRLRERGVYAITGGLGGIGLSIARHLATQYRARLLLIGRHALPAREQWAALTADSSSDESVAKRIRAIQELESAGAEVELAAGDVADLDTMRLAFSRARSRFGRIEGVFHAAGVLDDRLIARKTLHEANDVLRPKLEGTWVIHQLARDAGIELVVLFSSTSVLIGPPGQADYVAANAFMDAYAESRRGEPGPRALAIQWGVWRDVGMAADAARALREPGSARKRSRVPGPFFETRLDGVDAVVLEGRHGPASTWWLADHRMADGHAVVPGTGYLQLLAAGATELGLRRPFAIEGATFVRPLPVGDDETKSLRVRFRKEDGNYAAEVQSLYSEQGVDMGWLTHAAARVTSLDVRQPARLDLATIRARASARVLEDAGRIRTPQEHHLRFGPRFRCLRKAYFGEREALGELALDAEFATDVESTSLHAGLLDLGTGFAMALVPRYDAARGLWAPLSYRRVALHAPLPARCVAWVRRREGSSDASIGFDVTLCDVQGGVCVEVEELLLRPLPAGQTLGAGARPAAKDLEPDTALAPVRSKTALSAAETAFRANLEAGITPREGGPALELALTGHAPACMTISTLPPRALQEQLEAFVQPERAAGSRFSRPELDTAYVAPSDPLHKELVAIWEQTLGIDGIGIDDGFFELGGHSLTAVRLTAEIRKRFGVELGLAALFDAPTVARLGQLLSEARAGAVAAAQTQAVAAPSSSSGARLREFTPLVPIKPNGVRRPLFCIAGQGGNPMHLRTLAHYLGNDRPFYGLQHRGLDGRSVPYASVEEMARDFVQHLAEVDPGPYLIAGYSGGGTAAFEMARQLRAAGKGVDAVVLLDSLCPLDPRPGLAWRMRAHLEALQQEGVEYVTRRIAVRMKRERQRLERKFLRRASAVGQSRSQFETAAANWQTIESRYQPRPFPMSAFLLRVASRDADEARYFDERYARWSELFTLGVKQATVPGTHVSMCEEPNVQVLADRLRNVLDSLDASEHAAQ